jgi:hypothetical protein
MENQSTNTNIQNIQNINKVICRKCGGPHFTIKCGKEKPVEKPVEKQVEKFVEKKVKKQFDKNGEKTNNYKSKFRKTYRVKITELPTDILEEEMMELTSEWGHIMKVNVNNYELSSTAYIDFGFEEEANYFIKAINKTPFDYMIISTQMVDSFRHE